jgi:hypothetical protein
MKKLLLFFLAMTGMVGTVSADNVTKRIFVITDANFQTYQGAGLAVHAWYTDNSGDLFNQGNDNEKMATFEGFNPSGAKGLWFKDITFDAAKDIKFFVYKYNDTGWHSSDASQQVLTASAGLSCYEWSSNSNGDLTTKDSVTYYAYLFDGVSTWTQQALTTTNGVAYTTIIDNQTAFDDKLELIIAPSLAFEDDFSDYQWHMMFRPFAENQLVGFSNQLNYGGGSYGGGNSNSLKLNASAYYTLTFMPFEWKYSLEPYMTRSINEYATFSYDYSVAIPEGIKAYWAPSAADGQVSMTKFQNGIPANEGALLQGSGTVTFTPATSTDDVSGNLLEPTDGNTIAAGNYIFANQNGYGFYKVGQNGLSGVGKGKAYLNGSGISTARLAMNFGGETTGINSVESMQTNGTAYNMAGQRIAQPTKGLYIVNGKKVIMK